MLFGPFNAVSECPGHTSRLEASGLTIKKNCWNDVYNFSPDVGPRDPHFRLFSEEEAVAAADEFPLSISSWADTKSEDKALLSPRATHPRLLQFQALTETQQISPAPVSPEEKSNVLLESNVFTESFTVSSCSTPCSFAERTNAQTPDRGVSLIDISQTPDRGVSLIDISIDDATPITNRVLNDVTLSRRWQQLNSNCKEMSRAIAMLREAKQRQQRRLQQLRGIP